MIGITSAILRDKADDINRYLVLQNSHQTSNFQNIPEVIINPKGSLDNFSITTKTPFFKRHSTSLLKGINRITMERVIIQRVIKQKYGIKASDRKKIEDHIALLNQLRGSQIVINLLEAFEDDVNLYLVYKEAIPITHELEEYKLSNEFRVKKLLVNLIAALA